jgi:two-component system, sensor histidine kinase and response regulator
VFCANDRGGQVARYLLLPLWLILPFLGFITGIGQHFELDLSIALITLDVLIPIAVWTVAVILHRQEIERLRYCNELLAGNKFLNEQAAQLMVSEQKAKEALKARTEFINNVSHELRTPLTTIIGATELILSECQGPGEQELTSMALESARSLLGLVTDLLDFTDIETNTLKLETGWFSFRNVVEAAVTTLAAKAAQKHLQLNMSISADVPPILKGDSDRLKQVVINLLDNAVKFTQTGSASVEVVCEGDEPYMSVRFSVSDTGIGIAESDILTEGIFQPFTQLDGSTTRKYGGAGLGLSICRSLVGMMGGTMGVDSKLGCGSTFWFRIALEVPPVESEPAVPLLSG